MSKDVRAYLRQLRRQGFEIRYSEGRGSHCHVYLNGRLITPVGMNSSPVNLRNLRAQVKRRTRQP